MFLSYCSIAVLLSLSHTLLASPVINLSPFNGAPAIKERAAIDDLKELRRDNGAKSLRLRTINGTAVITPDQLEKFKLYSEYSAAAYCGAQQGEAGSRITCGTAGVCPKVERHNTRIYKTWAEEGSTGATGFVSYDASDDTVVLTMRGSVSLANWVTDIIFAQRPCPQYVPGAMCNVGFSDFWEQSRGPAFEGIEEVLRVHPFADIVITGHSLGGAAAVYATLELRARYGIDRVTLYTYGQPRVGNDVLSQLVTNQGNNYRVTHVDDGVPKLPPEEVPLVDTFTGVYRHISPEYWISRGLGNDITAFKKLEGLSNYEGNAGTGQLNLNIIAHIQYFQTNMYACVLPLPLELLGGAGT